MKAAKKPAVVAIVAVLAFFSWALPAYAESGCVEGIPGIEVLPGKLVAPPGEVAVFTVIIDNEDSENCPVKEFKLEADSDAGFSTSFSDSTLEAFPFEEENTLLKVRIPSDAAVGESIVRVTVIGGDFRNSESVILEVREEIEECTVRVSNIRFKERNADNFESRFSQNDEVSVLVDISLIGNTPSDVTLELFVEGQLYDSETDFFPANSDTVFKFGNKILTKTYSDRVDVDVRATPECNPDEADSQDDSFNIEEADEDVDIEYRVGTPGNTLVGEEILTRITIKNVGEEDTTVNVDAFLCKTSGGCEIEMNCGESIILVDSDDTEQVVCVAKTSEAGKYVIRSDVTFEGDEDFDKSSEFFVYQTQQELDSSMFNVVTPIKTGTEIEETESDFEPVEEPERVMQTRFVCRGDLRQAIYTTTVDVKTSDIEFCPFGCSEGRCTTPTVGTTMEETEEQSEERTDVTTVTQPKFSKPVFDLSDILDWFKSLFYSVSN